MRQNFLKKIVEHKAKEIAGSRRNIDERDLAERAAQPRERRSFQQALRSASPSDVRIIAEIKRASPSKGIFRQNLDPAALAAAYEAGGAAAISVLTDDAFFHGAAADLKAARAHTRLPVLRKDFIISSYQILEAAAWGADAVLLIVRILSERKLCALLELCRELQLDALVEVYAPAEIQTAIRAGAAIVGINNRNLETFQTDIQRAIQMAPLLGAQQIPVVASGIASRKDILQNLEAGLHNFLIGEHLVRADNPQQCIRSLKGR